MHIAGDLFLDPKAGEEFNAKNLCDPNFDPGINLSSLLKSIATSLSDKFLRNL